MLMCYNMNVCPYNFWRICFTLGNKNFTKKLFRVLLLEYNPVNSVENQMTHWRYVASIFRVKEYVKQETNMKQTTSLAYALTLKMEAIFSSQMTLHFQWSIGCYIPQHRTLHKHCCGNFRSHKNVSDMYPWRSQTPENNEQQSQSIWKGLTADMHSTG
jgi:hypothetical protein